MSNQYLGNAITSLLHDGIVIAPIRWAIGKRVEAIAAVCRDRAVRRKMLADWMRRRDGYGKA